MQPWKRYEVVNVKSNFSLVYSHVIQMKCKMHISAEFGFAIDNFFNKEEAISELGVYKVIGTLTN